MIPKKPKTKAKLANSNLIGEKDVLWHNNWWPFSRQTDTFEAKLNVFQTETSIFEKKTSPRRSKWFFASEKKLLLLFHKNW